MASEISLFSGYDQAENRTTNYCLLVLKMLYEESPKFLGEMLSALAGERVGESVGVVFRQQVRGKTSVPDGVIVQHGLHVIIETKRWDWFYDEQLESHLEYVAEREGVKVLLALGVFDQDPSVKFERVRRICAEQYGGTIMFAAASFEDFMAAIPVSGLSKPLADSISDFRAYLDAQGLLDNWSTWLDAVNCAGTADRVLRQRAYICPLLGGAYNHSRARYFGIYRDKRISHVAEIEAVIEWATDGPKVSWVNTNPRLPDAQIIERAGHEFEAWGDGLSEGRVFLLGELHPTNFEKDSKGGLFGSKTYFDIKRLKASGADDLAVFLNGRAWSEFR